MKKLFCLAAAALSMGLSAPASASWVLTTSDGVIFTIDTTAVTNQLSLQIENVLSSDGQWADATTLGALAIKDLGDNGSITGATLTPGSLTGVTNEMNANGCAGGDSGGWCFNALSNPFALSDDMQFLITFTGGAFNIADTGPHLKALFLDGVGKKVGSLLSANLPLNDPGCTVNCNPEIPEPATLALVGLALLGAGVARRRAR